MNSKIKSPNQRVLILISVLSIACFISLAFWQNHLSEINQSVNLWAANLQLSTGLTQAAIIVSELFDTTVLLAASLPIAGLLFYRKHKADTLQLIGVMGADAVALYVIKTLAAVQRPLNGVILADGFSFPSGHVTSTIVLFGMLTYFVWENQKNKFPKVAMAALTVVLAVTMAFDRIVLNVHWLTDVLAAPFLAIFILAVSILVFQRLKRWHNKNQSEVLFDSKA